jgi:hypothetical protein
LVTKLYTDEVFEPLQHEGVDYDTLDVF